MPTKQAWITWDEGPPVGGQPPYPDQGLPGVPPGYWGGVAPPLPALPIVIPGDPPTVIWPSPGHPAHPIAPGGAPPGYWGGVAPPLPTHPIAPGGKPPGYWGGGGMPAPTPPIAYPPIIWPQPPGGGPPIAIDPIHPENPIVLPLPPNVVWPPDVSVGHPIVIPLPPEIWPILPSHPIVIPPAPVPDRDPLFTWHAGWSDKTGWVIVAVPNFPHPAPAKASPPGQAKK